MTQNSPSASKLCRARAPPGTNSCWRPPAPTVLLEGWGGSGEQQDSPPPPKASHQRSAAFQGQWCTGCEQCTCRGTLGLRCVGLPNTLLFKCYLKK